MATAAQVRAFLERPWARLRAEKDRYLASLIERDGVTRAFAIAEDLRKHAELMGAWPTAADRAADLEAAVALRRKLDRASRRRATSFSRTNETAKHTIGTPMALSKKQSRLVREELLQQLRQPGWSVTHLARVLGVSQGHLSQVLNGKGVAGMKVLQALSAMTLKPIDEILGRQPPDLAIENDALKDEVRDLQAENERLRAALREVVDVAARHARLAR